MGRARRGRVRTVITFCSVGTSLVEHQQEIAPGGYHVVRFPYADKAEYTDEWNMHDRRHPDAYVVQDWTADDRSGFIWPNAEGWGCLEANIHWEAGDYTELRDRFVRDPEGVPDSTATDHRAPTTGLQAFTKQHWLKVRPAVPLVLMVSHDSTTPKKIVMAQFKLTVFPLG